MTRIRKELRTTADVVAAAISGRSYAPHCDAQILHAPNQCWACDGYPDWQQARQTWGINFTGDNDVDKLPCPAETRRPIESINRWGGNVAETAEEADARWAKWRTQMDKVFEPRRRRRGSR